MLQVLHNHSGPGDCANYVRHCDLTPVVEGKCSCPESNILVEIWPVHKINEVIDLASVEAHTMIHQFRNI